MVYYAAACVTNETKISNNSAFKRINTWWHEILRPKLVELFIMLATAFFHFYLFYFNLWLHNILIFAVQMVNMITGK